MILNPTTRALLLIGQAIECVTSSNHTFRVRVTFWINRSEVRSLQQATGEENRVCTIWQSPFKFFSDFISFPFYLIRPPFSKESDWVAVKREVTLVARDDSMQLGEVRTAKAGDFEHFRRLADSVEGWNLQYDKQGTKVYSKVKEGSTVRLIKVREKYVRSNSKS